MAKFTPASISASLVKIPSIKPSNRPCGSTKAPPDIPGFTAASVWIKSSMSLNPILERRTADTIPQVIPVPRPKLLPSAQTWLPIKGSSCRIAMPSADQFGSQNGNITSCVNCMNHCGGNIARKINNFNRFSSLQQHGQRS